MRLAVYEREKICGPAILKSSPTDFYVGIAEVKISHGRRTWKSNQQKESVTLHGCDDGGW